ncbi:MAG TPA: arginine N-succinyltransferase [Thermodesulfobacteriota bacterium]|nr:arginine N-succinyltransferase [Thermodesulfobacteriota bacterium]
MSDKNVPEPVVKKSRFGLRKVLGVLALVILVTALLTVWWVKHNIYASKFTPTALTIKEQKALDSKMAKLEATANKGPVVLKKKRQDKGAPLEPEPYSEEGAKREISLTEKELNALIANNPEVAQRVAIDLSENLISVKLVVPMDEEIPILGGKTLRLNLGVILGFENGRPVIALKGVSLGGIPLPNAWLGNLKNRNLVKEFGAEDGFWKLFSDGVADLKVQEGHILINLKE